LDLLDPRSHLKSYLITRKEWDALPEYSMSRPTGAVDGTQWRVHKPATAFFSECWILGEFKIVSPQVTTTFFYKPIFVDEVPEGERRVWL
jgi:hypothetical protein